MITSRVLGELIKHGENLKGELCFYDSKGRLLWNTARTDMCKLKAVMFIYGSKYRKQKEHDEDK